MGRVKRNIIRFAIVICFALIPALFSQLLVKEPIDRYVHITNFRYGKDPAVIRCNRGDRLHITFSTNDTGHSFFLEEFDMDVKVSPAREDVDVFSTRDPQSKPVTTKEVVFTARHPGIQNYVISKSNYRCHVWCGPMHAFEQGKLILFPNTLLIAGLGCLTGIVSIWLYGFLPGKVTRDKRGERDSGISDIMGKQGLFRRIIISRWPQTIFTLLAMLMIYIVILTSVFGTKVSGRNLGVLLMWAVWLFVLVALLTPFGGRIWCTICPLPFFGDMIQRKSFIASAGEKIRNFNNSFSGLFLKWPGYLNNNWLRLIVFLILATFSTTLVAVPRISGITVLMLLLVPTLMSGVWELRAFCRYVCPVSVFVAPYSRVSILALRNKSQQVCDQCKQNYCQSGSHAGWACPYGINVGEMKENTDCGLCLECTRSCLYNNVSLYTRPAAAELGTRSLSEAWMNIAVFTVAIIYSVLYLGPWPVLREFVNIIDKENYGLFAIYSLALLSLTLVIVPAIFYFLSYTGARLSGSDTGAKEVFQNSSGALLPMGLTLWIAFVIPMLFTNITFIRQSVSDPFGWGWDFFGTANIPWHQFLPQYIPWFQAILVLTGLFLSLRNLKTTWMINELSPAQARNISVPIASFLIFSAVAMLVFFTN